MAIKLGMEPPAGRQSQPTHIPSQFPCWLNR
ncbi:hypothetical protein COLO4_10094 [Corchorus olitorius]|uniref:Uncharacterized protein n=1 Tax=Corchorus olitorius TaxID=93759 RepID=A0A1R3K9Z9_9ROSI|nr:hypothetical protein COLO4_10094 [Corchorus olitorius]